MLAENAPGMDLQGKHRCMTPWLAAIYGPQFSYLLGQEPNMDPWASSSKVDLTT